MNVNVYLTMDVFLLIIVSVAGISTIGTLFLIFYHRRQYPINISTSLMCNTFLAIGLICLTLFDMHAYNLYGILQENISLDNWWCDKRAYLLYVGICSLYFSCLLKACFCLFRVVFYKYKQLQTFRFIFHLVIIQWLIAFLSMLLPLVSQYFKYTPQLYYCQLPFTDFRGFIILCSILYFFPTTAIAMIYCYIMYYIKFQTNTCMQQNRHRSYQRDLIILRRLIILIAILVTLSLPTIILCIYYIGTGYLHPLIYHIQWLLCSISLLILSIAITVLNPALKQLLSIVLRRNRRVQPEMIIPLRRLN